MSTFCTVCKEIKDRKKTTIKSRLSFFMYPKDAIKRLMWLKAVNREDLQFALKDKRRRRYLTICEKHFESKYIQSRYVQVLSEDAIPTLKLYKSSHENIRQCQNGTHEKEEIVCISVDECNINAFKIPTKLAENNYVNQTSIQRDNEIMKEVVDLGINDNSPPTIDLEEEDDKHLQSCRVHEEQPKTNDFKVPTLDLDEKDHANPAIIQTDKEERKEVIDLEINVNSAPLVSLEEQDKKIQSNSIYEDQPKINALKIPTFDLDEKDSVSQPSIHRDNIEMEAEINYEIDINSFPIISLKEKDDKNRETYIVYEDQPMVNAFRIPTLKLINKDSVCGTSVDREKERLTELIDLGENVNSFPIVNLHAEDGKQLQNYNEDQPKFGIVNTLNENKDPQKKTHLLIPRDYIVAIHKRLRFDVQYNCRSMNINERKIKLLMLLKERLRRRRSGIKRSLAMLRQNYISKVQKKEFIKPSQDPCVDIDLLDIKDEEINEKLKTSELSEQTETNTLNNEDMHTSSSSSRVELVHDPLPLKIFVSHTSNDDTLTSSMTSCTEVMSDSLPITFDVFDETEEDSAPVHLMTSHMSMDNSTSSMPDFLVPPVTPSMYTSVSATTSTEGVHPPVDDYDKFALSLAKSMKHLSNDSDKRNLVLAMQNLISEYVTRDLKSNLSNASQLRGLLNPVYSTRDQEAANPLLSSLLSTQRTSKRKRNN